jgi:hypothetical protein
MIPKIIEVIYIYRRKRRKYYGVMQIVLLLMEKGNRIFWRYPAHPTDFLFNSS